MKHSMLIVFSIIFISSALFAEEPVTEIKDWEPACGGSNILVTKVDGKILTLDAFAEHFDEGRQWQCHFKDGKIISAVHRHFTLTHNIAKDTHDTGSGVNFQFYKTTL